VTLTAESEALLVDLGYGDTSGTVVLAAVAEGLRNDLAAIEAAAVAQVKEAFWREHRCDTAAAPILAALPEGTVLTTVDAVSGDHVCSCGHRHAPLLGGTERLLGLPEVPTCPGCGFSDGHNMGCPVERARLLGLVESEVGGES